MKKNWKSFLSVLLSALLCLQISSGFALAAEDGDDTLNQSVVISAQDAADTSLNLTKQGGTDWILPIGNGKMERKANVGQLSLTQLPDTAVADFDSGVSFTWSDGETLATGTDYQEKGDCYGWNFGGAAGDVTGEAGYVITVPKQAQASCLTFYSGNWEAELETSIYINDSEKPFYTGTLVKGNKKVELGIRKNTSVKVVNRIKKKTHDSGNITLSAVTLAPVSMPPAEITVSKSDPTGMDLNLTETGTLDWNYINGDGSAIRKSTADSYLAFELFGDNVNPFTAANAAGWNYSWTDAAGESASGGPTRDACGIGYRTGDAQSVEVPIEADAGYKITVLRMQADTVLQVNTGLWASRTDFSIYVNDAEEPVYTDLNDPKGTGGMGSNYTVVIPKGNKITLKMKFGWKYHDSGNMTVSGITLSEGESSDTKQKDELQSLVNGLISSANVQLNQEIMIAQKLLGANPSEEVCYEQLFFLNLALAEKNGIDVEGGEKPQTGDYTFNTYPGLTASFGWEGDKHAPIAFIDGSYRLRDRNNLYVTFGVTDLTPECNIDWVNKEGYLPCFVSTYTKGSMDYTIENFADLVVINDRNYEIAYSRMTVTNHTAAVQTLPKVSAGLVPLNNAAKSQTTIAPGETVIRDYAIGADRFGNDYAYPSNMEIAAAGDFDTHYQHMKKYWDDRLKDLVDIVQLPDESLINAYKAGYIYMMIVKDGTGLNVGENEYDSVYDHDVIGMLVSLLNFGDFKYFKEYAARILETPQYLDARWKYSWPYAVYLQKTGDLDYITEQFETIKTNTHHIEAERDPKTGIMCETIAIDYNGSWLIDNWSALTGLTTYRYLCEQLYEETPNPEYLRESMWAEELYDSLLCATELQLEASMEKNRINYLPMSMKYSNEEGVYWDHFNNKWSDALTDPRNGNWGAHLLFGRWAWDGYLFNAPAGDLMVDLIDNTYSHILESRKGFSESDYQFGGYAHGFFSSAYNAGYAGAALRGEEYRDQGIKAYQYMIEHTMSGPYSWWEAIGDADWNGGAATAAGSLWGENHPASGGGSCQHMWGQSTATKVLLDSLISEKADGTVIIGRGIPEEWIAQDSPIQVENYPVAMGKRMGFSIIREGDTVILKLSGDANTPVSLELLALKDNIKAVSAGTFNNTLGTVSIPAGVSEVTVTLGEPEKKTYLVTVENGTLENQASSGQFQEGSTVTVTAEQPGDDMVFDKWTASSENVRFTDETAQTTTFVMPEEPVTITAVYRPKTYPVTVNRGTADKTTAQKGEKVTITSAAPIEGMVFDKWVISGNAVLDDAYDPVTSFVMPGEAVTITAYYKPVTYHVTVRGGTANVSDAACGDEVIITASPPQEGREFLHWSSKQPVIFKNQSGSSTSFIMPDCDVTITAVYRDSDPSVRTLADKATGITVTGKLSESSVLVVSPRNPNELQNLQSLFKNHIIIGAFEISIQNGTYQGPLTVVLPLDEKYNGKTIVMKHQLANGAVETIQSVCSNNQVVFSADELGVFMLGIVKDNIRPVDTPPTGDTVPWFVWFTLFSIISFIGALMHQKLKRRISQK